MIQPLLSILIPTVVGREDSLNNLLGVILSQIPKEELNPEVQMGVADNYSTYAIQTKNVEVIWCRDAKQLTIGEKRELLYRKAKGRYGWQIDDDDTISGNAIESILQAIKDGNVDCVTFQEKCLMNGNRHTCNHSLIYDDWRDNFDGYDFVRTPFYKDVIKTEIARAVPFEHIRYGEDHAWSRALKPHLKSEIHIPEELYIYQHNSKPEEFNERYGFDR